MRIRLAALAAAIAVVCAFGGTVASQDAQAFAWKDTCRIFVVNRVAQSAVRPILLTAIPPNPVAYATYAAVAATGFPTNTPVMFATTGIPVTYGCREYLNLNNPGDNVNVTAEAPTVGRNEFKSTGNSTFKVEKDDDDIVGTVYVGGRALGEESEAEEADNPLLAETADPFARKVAKPKTEAIPAGVLKKGALGGSGWRKTAAVKDLGQFGKLFEASDPKGKCGEDQPEPKPLSGGASLFVRGGGSEAVGELDGRYKSAGQSEKTLDAATSRSSMRCLAAALAAPGYKASVAAAGPDFGQGGIVTRRVVVKQNGGGFTGYVDVVGLADGRSNTVLVFFNRGKPAEVSQEEDVLAAVAEGLKP